MKRNEVNYNDLSPMMQQYMDIKKEHEDELLFYRIGDFYELFFEDGQIAARELELTLTGKNAGLSERVPMCGVPHHSVKPYLEKLIDKGYKVAICEQLEDPKNTKGMVKRGVIQVISKGTLTDNDMLNPHDYNYIGSVLDFGNTYLLTIADISAGILKTIDVKRDDETLINLILSLNIKEVVFIDSLLVNVINLLKNNYNIEVTYSKELLDNGYEYLFDNLNEKQINGVKHLLYYLVKTSMKDLSHISKVDIMDDNNYLKMDIHTERNLELFETLRLKERTYSLIWLLDKCKTAMGSRLLKEWMLHPLKDEDELNKRYDAISKLNTEFIIKDELRNLLYQVYDIERLCGKLTTGNMNARDMLQLKESLKVIPDITLNIKKLGFNYQIPNVLDLYELLDKAIYEDPPITLKDGYLIKEGYNKELDELKDIRKGGKDFVSKFEEKIKKETGLKNIKVGYNKVFGYYIEVSKAQSKMVKEDLGWERRQTLTNCERFISNELKEKEALILNAEEKIIEMEYNLFLEVKEILKKETFKLKILANILSEIDVLIALAVDAEELNLIRPKLTKDHVINIKEGRHPVVEKVSNTSFVPNDCVMDEKTNTLLITGPNMSGKSTYMRELAIIVIMAQMGSYVPCKEATLPIIDAIFTRIGASDDLVQGESTFMVEMKEANYAILNATSSSLVLFDELGRGTATYDGMSLAQAILEYITENVKCKTLFSTHYHELTSLAKVGTGIKNVHVDAKEEDGKITFLHKVKEGPIDKSYGIHVARLTNMPNSLLNRAEEILNKYETNAKKTKHNFEQVTFDFQEKQNDQKYQDIIDDIANLNIDNLRPIDALNELSLIKDKYNNINNK